MTHRTQLYLDEADFQFVKDTARKEKKSMAQLFREWVAEKRSKKRAKKYEDDSLFKARGLFKSGEPDFAYKIDDFLYGPDAK